MEYHITVNDSVFRMRNSRLCIILLFIGCFFVQFVVYCLFNNIGMIDNKYMEEYMPEIALLVTVIIVCLYCYIREKNTKGVMQLEFTFLNDSVRLMFNGKECMVKYNEIKEVCKIMVIDRIHTEKGCYRIKIKCHGRVSIEFETTRQEYEKHLDFEDTELFVFYNACGKAGLKCC